MSETNFPLQPLQMHELPIPPCVDERDRFIVSFVVGYRDAADDGEDEGVGSPRYAAALAHELITGGACVYVHDRQTGRRHIFDHWQTDAEKMEDCSARGPFFATVRSDGQWSVMLSGELVRACGNNSSEAEVFARTMNDALERTAKEPR